MQHHYRCTTDWLNLISSENLFTSHLYSLQSCTTITFRTPETSHPTQKLSNVRSAPIKPRFLPSRRYIKTATGTICPFRISNFVLRDDRCSRGRSTNAFFSTSQGSAGERWRHRTIYDRHLSGSRSGSLRILGRTSTCPSSWVWSSL